VVDYLKDKSKVLGEWMFLVLDEIRYEFDRPVRQIPKDAELTPVRITKLLNEDGIIDFEEEINTFEESREIEEEGEKPAFYRIGLPQGLSISPILATAVLNSLPKLEGLVMYADDGMIFRKRRDEGEKQVEKWFKDLALLGVKMDEKKSGQVGSEFKFLGVRFDLEKEEVTYEGSTYT